MRLLFVVLFASFTLLSYGQGKVDVLGYKYELRLSDTTDNISGIATIYFRAIVSTEFLELDFSNFNKEGKGMKITDLNTPAALDIRITASPVHVQYWHENNKLKIRLPKKLLAGETDTIALEYKGIPADGLIISKNKYGKRTFFADNWPNRAHNWIPCVDDPSDKATVEFLVTAPSHYQVISNGVQVEETNLPDNKKLTHYKEDVPLPTKIMVIGVADFAVNLAGEINCVPVYSWVYPENKKDGFYDYALAKDILSFYISYIGPFPYKKLANVQSKTIFGGMENAGAIFYSESSVTGTRQAEYLLAHEIVHQWFGDMATEKSFPHIWLSEGFATYLTHIYAESKLGFDKLNERMKEDRAQIIDLLKITSKPVVDSLSPTMELLSPNSYERGGWVLHMLRRQLGDSVFKRSVRSYYDQYKGKNAETKDLQAVFEKISGKKLDTFFRQWLFTADIPKLAVSWKYNEKQKNITITVNQLQKSGPFSFPLDISIPGSASVSTLQVNKASQTFSLPVKKRPSGLKIDPSVSMLFDGSVTELK